MPRGISEAAGCGARTSGSRAKPGLNATEDDGAGRPELPDGADRLGPLGRLTVRGDGDARRGASCDAIGLDDAGDFWAIVGRATERFAGAARVTPAERLGAAVCVGAIDRLGVARIGAAARSLDADLPPLPRWAWASLFPKTVKIAAMITLAVKQKPECRLVGMA